MEKREGETDRGVGRQGGRSIGKGRKEKIFWFGNCPLTLTAREREGEVLLAESASSVMELVEEDWEDGRAESSYKEREKGY